MVSATEIQKLMIETSTNGATRGYMLQQVLINLKMQQFTLKKFKMQQCKMKKVFKGDDQMIQISLYCFESNMKYKTMIYMIY